MLAFRWRPSAEEGGLSEDAGAVYEDVAVEADVADDERLISRAADRLGDVLVPRARARRPCTADTTTSAAARAADAAQPPTHLHLALGWRSATTPAAISRDAGHADMGVTFRIYTHVMALQPGDHAAPRARRRRRMGSNGQ